MKLLLGLVVLFAVLWTLAILFLRYLRKQAGNAMAKQYEMREKKYTWEDLGISDELVKETEEADLDLVEPPPGFAERVLQKIQEYEERLTKISDLKKDDVIQMGDARHEFDHMFDDMPPEYHLFVVEEIKTIGRTGFFVEAVVKQLDEDGAYNPDGRSVLLADSINGEKKVELVGQMNYDRTAMTYTRPRR